MTRKKLIRAARSLAHGVAPYGQDWMLFVTLAGGAFLASASNAYAPIAPHASRGGQVIRRQLAVATGMVATEHFDIRDYADFSVLTKTGTPGVSATIAISRTGKDADRSTVNRIQSVYDSWTRWDEANSYTDLRVLVEPATPAPAAPVTVDLLIYLRR